MELLKSLNIDPVLVIVNIIGFGLLYLILQRLVFNPIGKVLAEREGDIQKTYGQLDEDRAQMETLKNEYSQRLTNIEAEAREKIQGAIKEAQTTRDQIIGEANARAADVTSKAEKDVIYERERAMATLREEVVDLAIGATGKIIGDGLDENRQRKLINEFINAGTALNIPPHSNGSATPVAAGGVEA